MKLYGILGRKVNNNNSTSYQVGTHPSGGPLPVEAQIFIRVMGEDLFGARQLISDMSSQDRAIMMFWIEQISGLVYEVGSTEGN